VARGGEDAKKAGDWGRLGVQTLPKEELRALILERWAGQRSNGRLGERVKAAMRRKAVKGEAQGRPPEPTRPGTHRPRPS